MTQSEAEAALADILRPINSGVSTGPRPVYTFEKFVTEQYLTHDSLAALQVFNTSPTLFIRAGNPVCVHKEESGRHIIAEATDRIIRNRLTRSADYYEVAKNGLKYCPPPMDVVKDLLALPPLEWGFPALQGIEGFFKQRLGFALGERLGRRYGDSQVRIERDVHDRHGKVARWKVVLND